jgi:hypothetical protein
MSAADAWLRGRGRRRAIFDPPKPVETTEPERLGPFISQGARSSLPLAPPITPDDLLRRGNTLLGWWWLDPIAALAIAALAIREGVLSWRGKSCCAAC